VFFFVAFANALALVCFGWRSGEGSDLSLWLLCKGKGLNKIISDRLLRYTRSGERIHCTCLFLCTITINLPVTRHTGTCWRGILVLCQSSLGYLLSFPGSLSRQ
jgi:hypothetical protein